MQQTGLGQNRHIRRAVGRNPGTEHRADLISRRRERGGGARLVGERLEDRLEILLLVLRPDRGDLDLLPRERLARGVRSALAARR